MSRFAIDPPDDDRFADRPVDVQDAPRDGEPWGSVDPAERALHTLLDVMETFEVEIAKVNDSERAWVLRRMLLSAAKRVDAVSSDAADKADVMSVARR